jgi:hypothetical protein
MVVQLKLYVWGYGTPRDEYDLWHSIPQKITLWYKVFGVLGECMNEW